MREVVFLDPGLDVLRTSEPSAKYEGSLYEDQHFFLFGCFRS